MYELPQTSQLELQPETNWLTIRLNRPDTRNALSTAMIEELMRVLQTVRDSRLLRGITFCGNGGVFCAGGDIKDFKAVFQGQAGDPQTVAAANRRGGELFELIDTMPQVVVMRVEGAAIAGGMGMLCAADMVIATRESQFALSETALGITPAQIAPFVVRRIGLPAARRLMLTAARFDGVTAKASGLVDEIVDTPADLDLAEEKIRRQVRRCAPGAIAATKEILQAGGELSREALRHFAADHFARCMLGEEGREGIAAFIEKRKPAWSE